jgi:hypothetical protein
MRKILIINHIFAFFFNKIFFAFKIIKKILINKPFRYLNNIYREIFQFTAKQQKKWTRFYKMTVSSILPKISASRTCQGMSANSRSTRDSK